MKYMKENGVKYVVTSAGENRRRKSVDPKKTGIKENDDDNNSVIQRMLVLTMKTSYYYKLNWVFLQPCVVVRMPNFSPLPLSGNKVKYTCLFTNMLIAILQSRL